jgi:hypothetical protein
MYRVAVGYVSDVSEELASAISYLRNFSNTGDYHKVQKHEVINNEKLTLKLAG